MNSHIHVKIVIKGRMDGGGGGGGVSRYLLSYLLLSGLNIYQYYREKSLPPIKFYFPR